MKRFISFAIIIMLLLPLAACKRPDSPAPENTPEPAPQSTEQEEQPDATGEPSWADPTEAAEETLRPTPMPDHSAEKDDLPTIYAGENVFFVMDPEGALYGWGNNDYGQLAGREGNYTRPVYVASGLTPIIVGDTVFALDGEHTLFGWGRNDTAQLGQGDTKDRNTPVKVLENVKQCFCRWDSYYALTEGGELYRWGFGELQYSSRPDADRTEFMTPHKVFDNVEWFGEYFLITNSNELYSGYYGDEWTLRTEGVDAVWSDGRTTAVRGAENGALYALVGSEKVLLCDGGYRSVKASDGVIWVITEYGELCSYTVSESDAYERSDEAGRLEVVLNGVVAFDTAVYMDEDWGYEYKFALKANGELWSWAEHYGHILGKASYESSATPECVMTGVRSFTCSGAATYVVTENGEVWACGESIDRGFIYGGLGDGTENSSSAFVSTGLSGILKVQSRADQVFTDEGESDSVQVYTRTFAVDSEGRIYAWGWNGDGLLGTGSAEAEVLSPAEVHFAR